MSTLTVTVVGFYGRGNFGDDLMCLGLTRLLAQNEFVQVTVITSNPQAQSELLRSNINVVGRSVRTLLRAIWQSDIICQGGGTIFHDSFAPKQRLRYSVNLSLWALLFWMARMRGAQVVMLGSGIGPLTHPITRWISRIAFRACSAIGVRDVASLETLKSLLLDVPCELGFDLAALVPLAAPRYRSSENSEKLLAISACSLTAFSGDSRLNDLYWHGLGEALALFHQEQPIRIVFLSLFAGDSSERDENIGRLIASRLPATLIVENRIYMGGAERFCSEFTKCDWFLCAKFHAAVVAYLFGANMAVISYNRKVKDLADEIRLPSDRRVSADSPQPVAVWLAVLRSLAGRHLGTGILNRDQAEQRARWAVHSVFGAVGLETELSSMRKTAD